MSHDAATLARAIDAALPQTQCTRCGYPDCRSYARAIAFEGAAINQCPPGGAEGIARLAALTEQPIVPLSAEHGAESVRAVAIIDENWCIGCTLCIKACPVDAIVGANKTMHTILEADCTGCELCVPVCPVDCIAMQPVTDTTGWAAWSAAQAAQALARYQRRNARLESAKSRQPAQVRARRASAAAGDASAAAPAQGLAQGVAPQASATSEKAVTAVKAAPSKAALLAAIMEKASAKRSAHALAADAKADSSR